LSGHMHLSHSGSTAARYALGGYAALTIQAGTATSTRERGEPNSFNTIYIDGDEVRLQGHAWHPEERVFRVQSHTTFVREEAGWRKVAGVGAAA
jgi:hypothetical protein